MTRQLSILIEYTLDPITGIHIDAASVVAHAPVSPVPALPLKPVEGSLTEPGELWEITLLGKQLLLQLTEAAS